MSNTLYPAQWILFLALYRASYETASVGRAAPPAIPPNRGATPLSGAVEEEWAQKAIGSYARAQEKKWRRWSEAMFERCD